MRISKVTRGSHGYEAQSPIMEKSNGGSNKMVNNHITIKGGYVINARNQLEEAPRIFFDSHGRGRFIDGMVQDG